MKPISEWTDAELQGAAERDPIYYVAILAAEVLRLRRSLETCGYLWKSATERADKTEAELARIKAHNGECGDCDGWHFCCERVDAVAALHQPNNLGYCTRCVGTGAVYPCATAAALGVKA